MGSLGYVELLDNSKYRKFLHQELPWIGHAGIIHFFMTSLVRAAKNDGCGFVEFGVDSKTPWTSNIWIRLLITQKEKSLMRKLGRFILSLLAFAKPEMKIVDSEWGETSIDRREFLGTLVVLPVISLGEQVFDLLVHVRVVIPPRQKTVCIMKQSVTMELTFEKYWIVQVRKLC
jgi:hypothetical protein